MIGHIKSLCPELHGHALGDGCVLEQTHIKDDLARSKQQVARRVSVSEGSWCCKSRSIEPAGVRTLRPGKPWVFHEVGATREPSGLRGVKRHREWYSAPDIGNAGQLPSPDELAHRAR